MNAVYQSCVSVVKTFLVVTGLAMGILWPEWCIAQTVSAQRCVMGEATGPNACSAGESCIFLGPDSEFCVPVSELSVSSPCRETCTDRSNCEQECGLGCRINGNTLVCVDTKCGTFGKCFSPDSCEEVCRDASNCEKACRGENGVTKSCPSCGGQPPGPEPQPPGGPTPPAPIPTPTPDEALSNTYGVPLNDGRNGLFGFDHLFQGPRGAELRQAVSATAAEFGINPGFLAVNAGAEVRGGTAVTTLTSTNPVKSIQVGLDYWGSHLRKVVARDIHEARNIMSKELPERFRNRKKKDTGPVHEFPNGPTALRALAATLRYSEMQLSRDRKVGTKAWNNLPTGTRFAIVRAYYNGGPQIGLEMARNAVKGRNVLVTSGPVTSTGPDGKLRVHPRRAATIRAAQAVHMSQRHF